MAEGAPQLPASGTPGGPRREPGLAAASPKAGQEAHTRNLNRVFDRRSSERKPSRASPPPPALPAPKSPKPPRRAGPRRARPHRAQPRRQSRPGPPGLLVPRAACLNVRRGAAGAARGRRRSAVPVGTLMAPQGETRPGKQRSKPVRTPRGETSAESAREAPHPCAPGPRRGHLRGTFWNSPSTSRRSGLPLWAGGAAGGEPGRDSGRRRGTEDAEGGGIRLLFFCQKKKKKLRRGKEGSEMKMSSPRTPARLSSLPGDLQGDLQGWPAAGS